MKSLLNSVLSQAISILLVAAVTGALGALTVVFNFSPEWFTATCVGAFILGVFSGYNLCTWLGHQEEIREAARKKLELELADQRKKQEQERIKQEKLEKEFSNIKNLLRKLFVSDIAILKFAYDHEKFYWIPKDDNAAFQFFNLCQMHFLIHSYFTYSLSVYELSPNVRAYFDRNKDSFDLLNTHLKNTPDCYELKLLEKLEQEQHAHL